MTDQMTFRLGLPLVQAAQAQKHVTVNEALSRLDGMVNLVLVSVTQTEPPQAVIEGACYGIPKNATGAWSNHAGRIAIMSNGGWIFSDIRAGMQAYVADTGSPAIHDGGEWVSGAMTLGSSGSGLIAGTAESEVEITAGATVISDLVIPYAAMVIGATARVSEALTGTLTSWRMGTQSAPDRFGSGLGVQKDSWARGMLSHPVVYWDPEPVILSATGGEFTGGRVKVSAHWLELRLPR